MHAWPDGGRAKEARGERTEIAVQGGVEVGVLDVVSVGRCACQLNTGL